MTVFRRHPLLTLAFALALALTLFFAGRFVTRAIYWADPAHRDQPVAAWMTMGYIGRSWNLSPRDLDDAAGFARPEGKPLTLQQIADQRGVPVADVIRTVETAILTVKSQEALQHGTD